MRILSRFLLALSLVMGGPAWADAQGIQALGIAVKANAAAVTVARLQRILRAASSATIANPRTAGTYAGSVTITDNGTTNPSSVTGSAIYATNSSSRGIWHQTGGVYSGTAGVKAGLISSGTNSYTTNRTDVMFQGRYLTLRLNGTTSPYRFLVNGQYIATGNAYNNFTLSQSAAHDYVTLDFGSRIRARITVEGMQSAYVVGGYTELSGMLWPVDLSDAVHAVFLGDSYVQGASPGNYGDGVSPQLGDFMGQYITSSGSGGTGWQADGSGTVYNFAQRITNGDLGLSYYAPDVIYLFASVNDADVTKNFTTVQANALSGLVAARAQYPGVPIIVFGCANPPSKSATYITQNDAAVQAAVAARQAAGDSLVAFMPVYGDTAGKWLTGAASQLTFTGSLSAATSATLTTAWAGSTGSATIVDSSGVTHSASFTNGSTAVTSISPAITSTASASVYQTTDGNSRFFVVADWTHPTLEGAGYLGQRYAAAARAAIRSMYQSLLGAPVAISSIQLEPWWKDGGMNTIYSGYAQSRHRVASPPPGPRLTLADV